MDSILKWIFTILSQHILYYSLGSGQKECIFDKILHAVSWKEVSYTFSDFFMQLHLLDIAKDKQKSLDHQHRMDICWQYMNSRNFDAYITQYLIFVVNLQKSCLWYMVYWKKSSENKCSGFNGNILFQIVLSWWRKYQEKLCEKCLRSRHYFIYHSG